MKKNTQSESFSLWKSTSFNALQLALKQNAAISLVMQNGFDGQSDSVRLDGHFTDITDNVATFDVDTHGIPTGGNIGKIEHGALIGEISFNVQLATAVEKDVLANYSTRGDILQVDADENNNARRLLVRYYSRFNMRRLRRNVRIAWHAGIVSLGVVNGLPTNRKDLQNILKDTLRGEGEKKIRLVNISASGACVCVERQLAVRSLNGHERYLLLFAPEAPLKEQPPYIFLGKKAGMLKGVCSLRDAIALRMQFIYELDWTSSHACLQWNDIEGTGSNGIRLFVNKVVRANTSENES